MSFQWITIHLMQYHHTPCRDWCPLIEKEIEGNWFLGESVASISSGSVSPCFLSLSIVNHLFPRGRSRSPLFPITNLSVSHVGEQAAFLKGIRGSWRCSSTSFHGITCPKSACNLNFLLLVHWVKKKRNKCKKVKWHEKLTFWCDSAAKIKKINKYCVNLVWPFCSVVHRDYP